MERVLLDSSIYGKIIENRQEDIIRKAIDKDVLKGVFVIYGCNVVRKELRDTPRNIRVGGSQLRVTLLTLFDFLVKSHSFNINQEMRELAYHYYRIYRKIGGKRNENDIINDFLIVAGATTKRLDVVYSEDNKTMVSDKAVEAYKLVNEIKKLRTPNFENYSVFIKEIRRLLT